MRSFDWFTSASVSECSEKNEATRRWCKKEKKRKRCYNGDDSAIQRDAVVVGDDASICE